MVWVGIQARDSGSSAKQNESQVRDSGRSPPSKMGFRLGIQVELCQAKWDSGLGFRGIQGFTCQANMGFR